MSGRASRRLAWGVAALALLLMSAAEVLALTRESGADLGSDAFIWAIGLVFSVVGVIVAGREPRNAIGWVFLSAGVGAGLGAVSGSYADYWIGSGSGSETLGKTAAIYGDTSWVPFILLPVTFLLLLFPDGHLLSRRWRPVAWSAGVGIAATFVSGLLKPGPIEDYPQVRNLLGVDAVWVDVLTGLGALLVLIGLVGSVAALIIRFRRARGTQRQQMKWLAYAGAIAGGTLPLALAIYDTNETVANSAIMLTVLGIPVATGVAIVRHRLYDIDVVINRTLVYGALTAILAAAYLGCVLLLQLVLNGITGDSGLAVAASTLAVVALFRPARGRIQEVVDRRFYRRKYDAAQTLERFGAQLRDEVDLGALKAELRSVVADTMQPAHVSVWLRPPKAGP
jgi:hypothetical protein